MRLILVCVYLGVFLSDLSGAVVIKFTNFVCLSYNESWFLFHNCRLKAVSRDKVVLNSNGTVLHAAHNIQVQGKVFKRASAFKPWLIDTKIDVCRFVRNNYKQLSFKDFSNFNHTCPYVGPQIVKGFYLRPELFLLPFPTGKYM